MHVLRKDGRIWSCSCKHWEYVFDSDPTSPFNNDEEARKEFWQHKKDSEPKHPDDEAKERMFETMRSMPGCTFCGHEDHVSAECPSRLAEKLF